MVLSFFISERHGLCDIYFRIHSSWKKVQESPPLWRFSIDYTLFASLHLLHLIPATIITGTVLILCYHHIYVCPLGRAVKFSGVLAGTWKLLNIQWMNKFVFGFFLFLISLNKVTRWGSFHSKTLFMHVFRQQMFIEPLANAVLRTSGEQFWHFTGDRP